MSERSETAAGFLGAGKLFWALEEAAERSTRHGLEWQDNLSNRATAFAEGVCLGDWLLLPRSA